jgi:hypothetical protein
MGLDFFFIKKKGKVNANFLDETILVGIQTFITFLNGQKMAVGILGMRTK